MSNRRQHITSEVQRWGETRARILSGAIAEMIDVKRPVIFDCVVDPAENCFPMIPSGRAHNEMLLGDAAVSIEEAITEEGKMLV